MRVVFSIIGAVLGLSLASSSHELFGVLIGAFAGFGIAELGALRVKLKELEDELAALRKFAALQSGRAAEGQQGTAGQGSTTQPTSGWSAGAPSAPPAGSPSPHPARPTSPLPAAEQGAQREPAPGAWEPYAAAGRPTLGASSAMSSSTPSATAS